MPFPSPADLPDPGIEPKSMRWQADSLLLSHPGKHDFSIALPLSLSNGNETSLNIFLYHFHLNHINELPVEKFNLIKRYIKMSARFSDFRKPSL